MRRKTRHKNIFYCKTVMREKTEEDSDTSDDVNEMGNFLSNGSFVRSQIRFRGKTSNSTHDSLISNVDNNSNSSSFNSIGGEENKILDSMGCRG